MRKLDNDNPVCHECGTTHYQIEQTEALKKENKRLIDNLNKLTEAAKVVIEKLG